MNDPLATLESARRMAVGTGFSASTRPPLSPSCASSEEFDRLVTTYYKFFREEISADVSFLRGIHQSEEVRQFDRAIYNLRTHAQHSDNAAAADFAAQFYLDHGDWSGRANELARLFTAALVQLGRTALSAARTPTLAEKWRDSAAVDVGAIFAAVEADLALNFRPGTRDHMVREVTKRLQRERIVTDVRATTRDLCAQQMTFQRRVLPVPYHDVLDALGVLGSRDAKAALHLAYSIAAVAPRLPREAFLARVAEAWRTVAAK